MSYFDSIINPSTAEDTIREIVKAIEDSGLNPNFIAVRGASGIAAASALAIFTHLPIVIVRKEHEDAHGVDCERPDDFAIQGPYIIVDDGISTGKTIRAIIDKLEKRLTFHAKLVGVFVYDQDRMGGEDDRTFYVDALRRGAHSNIKLYDTKTGKSF